MQRRIAAPQTPNDPAFRCPRKTPHNVGLLPPQEVFGVEFTLRIPGGVPRHETRTREPNVDHPWDGAAFLVGWSSSCTARGDEDSCPNIPFKSSPMTGATGYAAYGCRWIKTLASIACAGRCAVCELLHEQPCVTAGLSILTGRTWQQHDVPYRHLPRRPVHFDLLEQAGYGGRLYGQAIDRRLQPGRFPRDPLVPRTARCTRTSRRWKDRQHRRRAESPAAAAERKPGQPFALGRRPRAPPRLRGSALATRGQVARRRLCWPTLP